MGKMKWPVNDDYSKNTNVGAIVRDLEKNDEILKANMFDIDPFKYLDETQVIYNTDPTDE